MGLRAFLIALGLHIGATAGVISSPTLFSSELTEGVSIESPVIEIPTAPIILSPFRTVRRGNTKRDRRFALELKSSEIFNWIGTDGTLAELKIETPGQDENIVSLEQIDDMVRKVECPSNTTGNLKIQFAQAADFDDAEDIWKWVNKSPANHFLIVLGAGTCGGNTNRVLYDVSGVEYVNEVETAVLKVKEATWKEAAHTFDLTIGKVEGAKAKRLVRARDRRVFFDDVKDSFDNVVDGVKTIPDKVNDVLDGLKDVPATIVDGVKDIPGKVVDGVKKLPGKVEDAVKKVPEKVEDIVKAIPIAPQAGDLLGDIDFDPNLSIPFDHKFPNEPLSFSANGLTVSAVCKDCFTQGSFEIKGKFRVELFEPKDAWVEMSTGGLTAKAVIVLGFKGALTGNPLKRSVPIFKVVPAGITIPGVVTIGPTVSVNMGVELGEISSSVNINVGGTATIPKSSARLDFLSNKSSSFSGWKPSFKAEPFPLNGNVEVKASAFIRPAIGLEVTVVESGFVAEVAASTPILTASIKAITSSNCTACGNSQNGIQGALTLGASIGASLKKKLLGDENAVFNFPFAEASIPIAEFCQGFGPMGDQCQAI